MTTYQTVRPEETPRYNGRVTVPAVVFTATALVMNSLRSAAEAGTAGTAKLTAVAVPMIPTNRRWALPAMTYSFIETMQRKSGAEGLQAGKYAPGGRYSGRLDIGEANRSYRTHRLPQH